MQKNTWHALNTSKQQGFNAVYLYLIAGIILLVAVFLLAVPAASAQTTEEAGSDVVSIEETASETDTSTEESSEEAVVSEEALEDNTVEAADLDVEEGAVLQDSFFYTFKRWGRAIQEAVTFNPVKKAELRLEHANQELVDARALIERRANDPEAVDAAQAAVERFEQKIEQIRDRAAAIRERHEENGDGEGILDKALDHHLKHQKLLEHIENRILENAPPQAAERMLDRLEKAKENAASHVGQFVGQVERNADALANRVDRVLNNQEGSSFKELRHLEVLQRVQDKAPEEAQAALEKVRERALERFRTSLSDSADTPDQMARLR